MGIWNASLYERLAILYRLMVESSKKCTARDVHKEFVTRERIAISLTAFRTHFAALRNAARMLYTLRAASATSAKRSIEAFFHSAVAKEFTSDQLRAIYQLGKACAVNALS